MKYLIPLLFLLGCAKETVCQPGYHKERISIPYRREFRSVMMCVKDQESK